MAKNSSRWTQDNQLWNVHGSRKNQYRETSGIHGEHSALVLPYNKTSWVIVDRYFHCIWDLEVLPPEGGSQRQTAPVASSLHWGSSASFHFFFSGGGISLWNVGHYPILNKLGIIFYHQVATWHVNGPGAATKVLKEICNVTELDDVLNGTSKCEGVTLLPEEMMQPIPHQMWKHYFTGGYGYKFEEVRMLSMVQISLSSKCHTKFCGYWLNFWQPELETFGGPIKGYMTDWLCKYWISLEGKKWWNETWRIISNSCIWEL